MKNPFSAAGEAARRMYHTRAFEVGEAVAGLALAATLAGTMVAEAASVDPEEACRELRTSAGIVAFEVTGEVPDWAKPDLMPLGESSAAYEALLGGASNAAPQPTCLEAVNPF
jgi:hypothetical protein